MIHEPECPYREFSSVRAESCRYCKCIRYAYRRGYNDHARTVQHWQDTHGAYRAVLETRERKTREWEARWADEHYNQHGEVVTHQCPPDGVYLMPCCDISPLEKLADRMTLDPALVTCTGRRP